jgi:hypothetical protein
MKIIRSKLLKCGFISMTTYQFDIGLWLWYLTPLSTIFQLYDGANLI